jgi:hypothetical protein
MEKESRRYMKNKKPDRFTPGASALIVLAVVTILAVPSASFGLLQERGIEPLAIETGARPIGMGSAFIAVSDDSNALFFNPAGIARTKGLIFTVRDFGNFSAGDVFPTEYGFSFGIGYVRNSVNDLEYSTGESNAYSSALVASLGLQLNFMSNLFGPEDFWDRIDVGFDYKYLLDQSLRHTGDPDKAATGWDSDLGLIVRPISWIRIGATAKNFLGRDSGAGVLEWDTEEKEDIPASTNLGLAVKIVGDKNCPIYMENYELTLSSDFSIRETSPKSLYSFGAEWVYAGTYMFRLGGKQKPLVDKNDMIASAGFGARYGYWGFDVAYTTDYLKDSPAFYFSVLYWPKEWYFMEKPGMTKKEQGEKENIPVEKAPALVSTEEGEVVKILGPEELVTDADTVTISGVVLKPKAKVMINGNPVEVGKDNRFDVGVPLNVGKNVIDITTDYKGRQTRIQRKVLRKLKIVAPEEVKLEEQISKEIKPKEAEIIAAEKKLIEKGKAPMTEVQKKEIEVEKNNIQKEKVQLEAKKVKIEKKKKEIAETKTIVEDLATLGIIDVSPDRVFEVQSPMTRGEFASWIIKAKGLPLPKLSGAPFPDVPASHKFAPYIKLIVELKIMSAYPDGTFKPDRALTQVEAREAFDKLSK